MKHVIIIGAQRCGSTLIYNLLDQHPEIMMGKPIRPEPKYFLYQRDYTDIESVYREYIQKYYSSPSQGTKYFGEKSTSYIESPLAAKRICLTLPEVKFLCVVRDPVLRAISNYNFSVANGLESENFETAIYRSKAEIEKMFNHETSVNPYNYIQRGFYATYMKQYLKVVNRDQIKILVLEKLIKKPELLNDVFRWLDVSTIEIDFPLNKKVNATAMQASIETNTIMNIGNIYMDSIKELRDMFDLDIGIWEANPWYLKN